ncbi:MAG: 1-acyl-sn-glycerol-3-phosphate acyltransferase [Oscillospiraceae bacterium]|jgi:hypothetical protein
MERKKTSLFYKLIRLIVQLVYPKPQVEGMENLPDEPAIIVGNHAQMHGPIACELYFPGRHYIWCAGEMMHLKEVPAYAYRDFWFNKPKYIRWFYRLLSYIIAPLSVSIFNNANTIAVYRDGRIISTFKETSNALADGANVIIFPECYEPYNHIVYNFQEGFVDIARLYYKKTGKEVSFVPLYMAPKLRKMVIGKPIRYRPQADKQEERTRICTYLMDEITEMACNLPKHTVVPYPNVTKKEYPYNIAGEGDRPVRKKRTPVVDYRKLRLSNLNSPEFSHLKLLLGWVGYFVMYLLTENLIPVERCYPIHCWLDDVIPFCEWFVIPYVFWYLLVAGSLLYFLLYNVENFKNLQKYIIVTQIVAMAVYIIFPNRQDLRPAVFPRDNALTQLLGFIYSVDTNTGVCPSLHVAYSIGIASTWLREKSVSKWWRGVIVVLSGIICISVAFVKQHSVVDIIAAIPLCLLAEWLVYGKHRKRTELSAET